MLLDSSSPLLGGIVLPRSDRSTQADLWQQREKDRKGGIYGAGAINRGKGPSAELIYVDLRVFVCHFTVSHAISL